MTQLPPAPIARGAPGPRHWRTVLMVVVAIGGIGVLTLVGRSTLTASLESFAHLHWSWIPLAVFAEVGSMAAFARAQRRLLRAGGTDVHLGSVMAVTYAGNAISVSLPLAGAEVATAFTYRQFSKRGIDPAVAGWTLAMSGIFSSFAFALVLAAGAAASDNPTAAALGVTGAVVSLLPAVTVVATLRFRGALRLANWVLGHLISFSRSLIKRPGPGAELILERFLDRLAGLRLPAVQYAEVLMLAVWNWVADCLCLVAAIRATGARVPWAGLLLAYGAAMTAGSLGLTPGGIGIIEASLTAALVAAGISSHHALAAVLVYRIVSFWLVMAAGWLVLAVITRTSPAD